MYTIIVLGGIWFWLLVVGEIIFLYNCMGLEKTRGSNATASLVGFLTFLFCFSNLKSWVVDHWGWGNLAYVLLIALAYVVLGLCWSFFWMWPRWGQKRKQIHKKNLTAWLETQGIRGDECPADLKKELNLVVFGNEKQETIELLLKEVRDTYAKNMPNAKGQDDNRGTSRRFIPKESDPEFETFIVETDPESIQDAILRREVSELRRAWLKTQKVHHTEHGIVIPERLHERFRERIHTPWSRRSPDIRWAEVATEPLFRNNKGKLATWAAWWPFSVIWFIFHDLFHEIAQWAIQVFEGIGQALMHKQYKDVRADFEHDEPHIPKK